ncbi:hypothetical protein BZA70DRAFT_234202 [Myxozyma melibiosi]|uniref:Uncharacterized protein n=1 Tax=Myxozyma melibiosi TaxID=54550 RepID=A0ABR1FAX2_9ASCO
MSAGWPSASTIATRCNSPPDKFWTSRSMRSSMRSGLQTSVWNWGSRNDERIFLKKSWRTVPWNFGEIFCGFMLTDMAGSFLPLSGSKLPASRRQKVVFPVPFSPIMTMISESVKSPAWTRMWKSPIVFSIDGYLKLRLLSIMSMSPASANRNCSDSSRKRKFSVGMFPSRKMLIPSRTDDGKLTTP